MASFIPPWILSSPNFTILDNVPSIYDVMSEGNNVPKGKVEAPKSAQAQLYTLYLNLELNKKAGGFYFLPFSEKKPSLLIASFEALLLGPSPLATKTPTFSPTASCISETSLCLNPGQRRIE